MKRIRIRPRHVEVIRLRPGDTLVYHSAKPLTHPAIDAIRHQLEHLVPDGIKTAVLEPGATLKVLRTEETANTPTDEKP